MQEFRPHPRKIPPILQVQESPKIREWDKHFPPLTRSAIRHKRGRPEPLPRPSRCRQENPRIDCKLGYWIGDISVGSKYTFCNVGYGRRFLFACVGGGRGYFPNLSQNFGTDRGIPEKIKFARLPYGNISGVLRTVVTYYAGTKQACIGCQSATAGYLHICG